jgi:hypothetical protein
VARPSAPGVAGVATTSSSDGVSDVL